MTRIFTVDREADYILHDGHRALLRSDDPAKRQFVGGREGYVNFWYFSQKRFQKMLREGYIQMAERGAAPPFIRYQFTEKADKYEGNYT